MNTSFTNKCCLLVIRGAINLLILSALAAGFLIGPTLSAFAWSSTQSSRMDAFNKFCTFYYNDGNDSEAASDVTACMGESSAFASLLKDEAQDPGQWPTRSLDYLAQHQELTDNQGNGSITTSHEFANSITDSDLKALIGGKGNSNLGIPKDNQFLPTLWGYNTKDDTFNSLDISSACTNPPSLSHSSIWSSVGPQLLKVASQKLGATENQIYGGLIPDGDCSFATLIQNQYGVSSATNAYKMEKQMLITVRHHFQQANPSNLNSILSGLNWAISKSKNDPTEVDEWVSFAINNFPN
ncbi:MAG TPA: hypothetical protein VGL94_07970 [Ktedonobacteraceae bacterium]|jgi:hypothetical protein